MKNFLPFFFVFLLLGVSLVAAGMYGQKLYGAGSYGIGQQAADASGSSTSGSSPSSTSTTSTTSNASTTPPVQVPVVNWTSTQEAPIASVNSTTGYAVLLAPSARVQVTVENEVHFVGLVNVTGNSALLIVQSDPQLVTLNVNAEKKLELSGDNYYDLYLKLNSVSNGSASFTIKTIHELVASAASGTSGASNVTVPSDAAGSDKAAVPSSSGAKPPELPLPLIAVVVLIIAVVAYYFLQSNKKQKGL